MTGNENGVDIRSMRIGLMSAERMIELCSDEVTKPETIGYKNGRPVKDGLFCERIFGPVDDYKCACGRYKGIKYEGHTCPVCGVEIIPSSVRRDRLGYIRLAAPVSHVWFFKGAPSVMALALNMPYSKLEQVLYYGGHVVLDSGNTSLIYKQVLTRTEYSEALERYGNAFRVGIGAEAVREMLKNVDLAAELETLRKVISDSSSPNKAKAVKRYEILKGFYEAGNKLEWMILDVIPVLPPDLRPLVMLNGGRYAVSDINEHYRRIMLCNNRLARFMELGAPDIVLNYEKRLLQDAVDALIDNGRHGKTAIGANGRELKSLTDTLKGKQGRFRKNLLGKRVDFSGRSVIVVGPELKMYQCGLPKEMAIELFKPFVMKELITRAIAQNYKAAKKMIECLDSVVWDILEEVIKEHPVMLNRAPTLHRLGIQAFEPVLVEGKAIRLHPLVCTAFNADFDGDQMAVHVPLSVEAQAECRFLMLSSNNLLKPSDGGLVAVPSQDMVLGIYYLTLLKEGDKGEGKIFKGVNEALLAYENGAISLHASILVRREVTLLNGEIVSGTVRTTLGRLLFNEVVPQDIGIRTRMCKDDYILPEIDYLVGKKQLKKIIEKCIATHGVEKTAVVLDEIKKLGYKYSTKAAMTVSISDMAVPENKQQILAEAAAQVEQIKRNYQRGLTTEEERYKAVIETWKNADDKITEALLTGLDRYNNIFMMADSGARGSDKQIKQLAGMRGLMADTSGRTIELPIKSNFREGLDVLEYFISAHGARKGLSDTALRTADSGYLTRRLVDVSQEVIVCQQDCACGEDEIPGIYVKAFRYGNEIIESLEERITGRCAGETIYNDSGDVIVHRNQLITAKRAAEIVATQKIRSAGADATIKIRSVLTCRSRRGVCARCYGTDLSNGTIVCEGVTVGVVAAQSIGEPGTQLTMRTFHTGGVAGDDITQGLPRVEELFEARKPNGLAIISDRTGMVTIKQTPKRREVCVSDDCGTSSFVVPYGARLTVEAGAVVNVGDLLTEGSVDLKSLLAICGVRAVQDYILSEVQRVYRLQGVEISDKHIEIIVRQMLRRVLICDGGDTMFLSGEKVDIADYEHENRIMLEKGLRPAEGERMLLGITKASLCAESFLAAASFQETTKVLTEAAVKGKEDALSGLKENVILGKTIPAGTGYPLYRRIVLNTDEEPYDDYEIVCDYIYEENFFKKEVKEKGIS